MIHILFFGPVTAHVDSREMQLEFQPGWRLHDVVVQLQARYPEAFDIICFTAVNELQTRDLQLPLADNDEIAFMAKFSGG